LKAIFIKFYESLIYLFLMRKEVRVNNSLNFHSSSYLPSEYEYIHIPKCAGSTIKFALGELEEFGSLQHKTLSSEDFIRLQSGLDINTKYITFLRDPVDRVWSHYQMIKREGHFAYGRYTSSLEEFLQHCWEVNNIYVQYFSLTVRSNLISKKELEDAISCLEQFYFIGRMDNIENDWKSLEIKMKHDSKIDLPKIQHLNKANNIYLPSENDVALISEYNKLDVILWKRLNSLDFFHKQSPN